MILGWHNTLPGTPGHALSFQLLQETLCVCVCVYVGKTDIVNIYYMYIVAGVARSQALPVTLLHTGESLGTRLLQVCMKLIA